MNTATGCRRRPVGSVVRVILGTAEAPTTLLAGVFTGWRFRSCRGLAAGRAGDPGPSLSLVE